MSNVLRSNTSLAVRFPGNNFSPSKYVKSKLLSFSAVASAASLKVPPVNFLFPRESTVVLSKTFSTNALAIRCI